MNQEVGPERSRGTLLKAAWISLYRLAFGAAFVLVTVLVWRVFMVGTWWAGADLLWTAEGTCADLTGWSRVWTAFIGEDECGSLHWGLSVLLMLIAIWAVARAFFPPAYPPEHQPGVDAVPAALTRATAAADRAAGAAEAAAQAAATLAAAAGLRKGAVAPDQARESEGTAAKA
jgi:hypothetical protein